MPWVGKHDFGLLNLFATRNGNAGNEYAILMSRPAGNAELAPVLEIVSSHPAGLPNWSTHTAIVNAIQQRAANQGNLGNLLVFSTYAPTPACLGMMKTHGLNSVTYFLNGAKQFIDVAGQANVANMVPGGYPATAAPNRINTPGPQLPQQGLLANPGANIGGVTALTYLNQVAGQANVASYAQWRASWANNRAPVPARNGPPLQQYMAAAAGLNQNDVDTAFMLLVYAIAGRVAWPGDESGSRIVGLLGNLQGQVLGWQVNHRHINTTFHAETNLIQGIGQIPGGATLYSTLEPCHQCAGLFVRAGGVRCVFGQNDPNMTGNTALAGTAIRLQRPTFFDLSNRPPMTVGSRLDQIRNFSSVAAQAAAVARTAAPNMQGAATQFNLAARALPLGQPAPATMPNQNIVRNAVAGTNYAGLQVRVLNILNTAPSRELFAQSLDLLRSYIERIRAFQDVGQPERTFADNLGRPLNI
jgi:tRNA(Arg) A34 adenosine deaminase TadA